jgi:DNA-binding transcriptional ArsR family regulator
MTSPKLTAEERAKVFKALSDPRRIDIVDALAKKGSLCGTQLAEQLDISLALLCHHWDVLIDAGLVKKERIGQLRVCTLDSERLQEATGTWAGETPRIKAKTKTKANTSARAAAGRARKR